MNEHEYSADGLIHDAERLRELQSLPLSRKIAITQARIIEWYEHFNGNVYISYSGGKDSTVLADLVHRIYPDVPMVYSNTGLEYLEIQKFAKDKGATFIRPNMAFMDVIKTYGYPIVSKEVSEAIYYARRNNSHSVNVERERERESNVKNLSTNDSNYSAKGHQVVARNSGSREPKLTEDYV